MAAERKKVFVAVSGGVDSSTAAALLNQNGFNCAGVFMITCDESHHAQADAEHVAKKLGIKLYVLDLRRDFERILDYFCSEYRKARTPNPCVLCNRYIKFGKLWDFARSNGAGLLATGHYARILPATLGSDRYPPLAGHNKHPGLSLSKLVSKLESRNRKLEKTSFEFPGRASIRASTTLNEKYFKTDIGLYESLNAAKDQSYVLSMINKEILPYVILPMGNYSKDQTRQMAAKFGLGIEHKAESQELCFIPDDDYVAVLEQRCPELVRKGNIIDSSGKVLGEHNGVHRFTIGQRRGLRVAMGKPYYVVKIDAESNTVTLGPKEEVMHSKLWATGVNWLTDEPMLPFRAKVKIRYNDRGAPARVSPQGNSVAIEFDEPNSAITPGQVAAFYVQEGNNSRLIGGGWIDKVEEGNS